MLEQSTAGPQNAPNNGGGCTDDTLGTTLLALHCDGSVLVLDLSCAGTALVYFLVLDWFFDGAVVVQYWHHTATGLLYWHCAVVALYWNHTRTALALHWY